MFKMQRFGRTIIREWPWSSTSLLRKSAQVGGSCRAPTLLQFYNFHGQSKEQRKQSGEEKQQEIDCKILGVPLDCRDEATVRDAYIKLAKRYHPDSRSADANSAMFQEIDSAYRNFLNYFSDFRHNRHKIEGEYGLYYKERAEESPEEKKEEEVESPDIKHTAPQHRQFLTFDGIGSGTPRQREKQYQKWRAMKAIENVLDHRMEQVTKNSGQEVWDLVKEQKEAKKIKTGIGVDRLVEDMIQEAMARGDFDNLRGKGKPLTSATAYNPYIDFTTHKLNQVLIENGFAPEWILLEKEIKEELRRIKRQLREIRHIFNNSLSNEEKEEWRDYVEALRPDCDKLNKMILKYNLTVPSLHKQLMGLQLDRVADKTLAEFDAEFHEICKKKAKENKERRESSNYGSGGNSSNETFLGSLLSIFKI